MAKKLHHSCKPENIIEDLTNRDYKIIDAANKLSRKNKEPLDMFILSFSAEESTQKIYKINNIMKCRVKIEPIKKNNLVPQCKICQAYGHTQKYCGKAPRCVKCAGKHHTSECERPKNLPPKCIHCGGLHPANYRGCIIAKELQKTKSKGTSKLNMPHQRTISNDNERKQMNKQSEPNISGRQKSYKRTYAGVAQSAVDGSSNHKKEQGDEIKETLMLILSKINKIENSITVMDGRVMKLESNSKKVALKLKKK